MDLQITTVSEDGKKVVFPSGKDKKPADKRYFIVMDILYSLHFNEIYQNIYEIYNKSQYYDPVRQYQPKCLHVGIKESGRTNTQFFCDNGKYGNFKFDNSILLPEFKGIASKHYNSDRGGLRSVFINFNGVDDSRLASMLGVSGVDKNAVASNLNGASLQNISYVRNRLKSEFGITDIQFCGIAGNFVQESSFYPTTEQYVGKPIKGGKGLAQWTDDRRVAAEEWLGMPIIKAPLSRQVDYLIYELKNTEKSTIPAIKGTNTVSDAVIAFEKNFERAGTPNFKKRIEYGNLVKKYIESGQIS